MNEIAKIEDKINREISNQIAVGTGGIAFQNAGEVMEYAKMMAVSGSAVPKHLRGQPGACLGIIDDAIRFQTSPYALARKSYFVNDNLAYEAQVLAGIVNRFAPLTERPLIEFSGEGDGRVCKVTGTFRDGSTRSVESPKFSQIHPKNSPLWKSDPDQQLSYYTLRTFARRHCPEILLGMYDVEEARTMRDVTPQHEPLQKRLQQAQQSVSDESPEGFSVAHVEREAASVDETELADDAGESGDETSASTSPCTQADDEGVEAAAPLMPPALTNSTEKLREAAEKFIRTAAERDLSDAEKRQTLAEMKETWKSHIPDQIDFLRECYTGALRILTNKSTPSAVKAELFKLAGISE